jgi:hypothetical protein
MPDVFSLIPPFRVKSRATAGFRVVKVFHFGFLSVSIFI